MQRDYGRTTITVPLELKQRMKMARAHVNWSAVACDAFERRLEELGPVEEISSVEDALSRMKSINEKITSPGRDECQTGKQAGRRWALNFASPSQLQRIEDFRNQVPDDDWQALMDSREGCEELANCIEPPRDRRPGSIQSEPFPGDQWEDIHRGPRKNRRPRIRKGPRREMEIWRSILDRRPEHRGFFLAFAEGALEVWKQIKDRL